MTYTIAVANEKGGVAKTTTCVSLAGALSQLGKKILVVDMDPQSNLTLGFGHNPKSLEKSIAQLMLNSLEINDVISKTNIENIDLIPSNAEMGLSERYLPIRENYHTILKKSFIKLENYDFIIIDCPPALGAITLNALTAADLLILPSQPEFFSAYALRSMMQAIKQVRQQDNPKLTYKILITILDRRNRTHRTMTEKIYSTFNDAVFKSVIEIDTKIRESSIVGLPINLYNPTTRGAIQYMNLAKEIIKDVKK
jgi:chromosome partitioning protein